MEGPIGPDTVRALLGLLPAGVAEQVLASLDPKDAQRLRAHLTGSSPATATPESTHALRTFFDMVRIASRPGTPAKATNQPAATVVEDPAADPMQALRKMDAGILVRALEEEQAGTIAMIVAKLDPRLASDILKRLPANRRLEVALRLNQPPMPNPVLLERLARATIQKARHVADLPIAPPAEERVRGLAAVLRRLGRTDRAEVLNAIAQQDPQAVENIRKQMFRFEDIQFVEDRPLQSLLTEVDPKTLATALKGAPNEVAEKIFRNTSSRSRQLLTDEIGLLPTALSRATIEEAQGRIADLLRQHEEEGKITLEN